MVEYEEELIPPTGLLGKGGAATLAVFVVLLGVFLVSPLAGRHNETSDLIPRIFLAMFGAGGALFALLLLPISVSWHIRAGQLHRRSRSLVRSWDSSFPGLKHFEIVHGIWEDGKGSTDSLQFWVDGKRRPVEIPNTNNAYQWHVKRQGLPPSLIQPLDRRDLPSDPLATRVNWGLLELGVYFAKRTGRPVLFSQKVVAPPGRD